MNRRCVVSRCLTMPWAILAMAACDSWNPATVDGPITRPTSTASLSGQVFEVTPMGRFPLPNVLVTASVTPGAGLTILRTTTGADGRYSFPQLPPTSAILHAHSAGYRQICGAWPTLTATTQQDLEVTSNSNPQRSPAPAPLTVTGQIYEMTSAGRVGLAGAVIHVYWANDGYFHTVVADANGKYVACGIPANRLLAFEGAINLAAGYDGEYETPYSWHQFSADTILDIELKRRPEGQS